MRPVIFCLMILCCLFFSQRQTAAMPEQEESPEHAVKTVCGIEKVLAKIPSIEEVREEALLYNEVHPEKIKKWRKALKYRALLPTFSLDYDKNIYGTAGGATYEGRCYVGPYDWGVSLSWDMADLIWNSYEDDVDTRSRLITQTRKYTLDKLNELYFELVRLYLEKDRPGSEDEQAVIEREVRTRELIAGLDGYTGGYFSRRVRDLSRP